MGLQQPGHRDDITGTKLPCRRVGHAVRNRSHFLQRGEIDTA